MLILSMSIMSKKTPVNNERRCAKERRREARATPMGFHRRGQVRPRTIRSSESHIPSNRVSPRPCSRFETTFITFPSLARHQNNHLARWSLPKPFPSDSPSPESEDPFPVTISMQKTTQESKPGIQANKSQHVKFLLPYPMDITTRTRPRSGPHNQSRPP